MKKRIKSWPMIRRVIYSVLVIALLVCVFAAMIRYIYTDAERDAFANLRMQAQRCAEDINLQIFSDQENLLTMSRMAARHYEKGEGYGVLLEIFESIGMIESLAILQPDDTLLTRHGTVDASGTLSFAEEVEKGIYISGRMTDVTNPDLELVRSAVPIISGGETVAILYGAINLESFEARYMNYLNDFNAYLFLVEKESGNLILDTKHDAPGNLYAFGSREAKDGFSHNRMLLDLQEGIPGNTAFMSNDLGEYLYACYMPLEVSDWQLILAKPEGVFFSRAHTIGTILSLSFIAVCIIMILYVVLLFATEKNQMDVASKAAAVRKLLIGINQHKENIGSALEQIAKFSKSCSTFYVDSDGEEYVYVSPAFRDTHLRGEDRRFFIDSIIHYARSHMKNNGTALLTVKRSRNAALKKQAPEQYAFLEKHGIRNVCITFIFNENGDLRILGMLNPSKKSQSRRFLEEIAVCFSMAIHNKKYLAQTEMIAVTDSLTGLENRLAYKRAVSAYDKKMSEQFSCVYVDVNELHIVNNYYGHAAGDEMLLFIANALQEEFPNGSIYRIGGDEFLAFNENLPREEVLSAIEALQKKVEKRDYHISIGMDYRSRNLDTESVVKRAEERMYEAKAEYYQQKSRQKLAELSIQQVEHMDTGIRELDAVLPILGEHYMGVYSVSFVLDTARSILMPTFFKQFTEKEGSFSKAMVEYTHEIVNPDYHRAVLNFINYDMLRRKLAEGYVQELTYARIKGDYVTLKIYPFPGQKGEVTDSLWIFERTNK